MKGTCLKCGCTAEKPCWHPDGSRPCGWIDEQQDLCDRCAGLLLGSPIEPAELAEAALLIRVLRAMLAHTVARQEHIELLLYQIAGAEPGGEIAIEVPSGIWTPE